MIRQGDVLVFDAPRAARKGAEVPAEGGRVVLARGELSGHAHALDTAHAQLFERTDSVREGLGLHAQPGDRVLRVCAQTPLVHEEHGPIPQARGRRIVRMQREYHPTELRRVKD